MAPDLRTEPISREEDKRACARMMASTQPWISLGFDEAFCLKRTADTQKEILGAWSSGRLTGFLLLDMRGPFAGYIQTVCVEAERRGAGIGSALIRAAEERVHRDSPNVFLCVSTTNDRARVLYERLGYARVGELPDYLARGRTEILMRKTAGTLLDFRAPGSAS
ncbi:MAG: N-acetyltransferase [Acidobacteriota bacterium]